jgi:hypothetical protein
MSGTIAQMTIPSDSIGSTPTQTIIDWVNGNIFIINDAGIRLYTTTYETQNPILSVAQTNANSIICPTDADPVTGSLIISSGAPDVIFNKYNPATLENTGSYSVGGLTGFNQTVCVGCGTLASGGTEQVGYILSKISGAGASGGNVQILFVNSMTLASTNLTVVTVGADKGGQMVRGHSGATGGTVYVTTKSVIGENPLASVPIYQILISPGAETYGGSGANPYIAVSTIGTIAASSIDSQWTTWVPTDIGYDGSDGNIIIFAENLQEGVENQTYFLKASSADASLIWKVALTPGNMSLHASSIIYGNFTFVSTVDADRIALFSFNTANGTYTDTTYSRIDIVVGAPYSETISSDTLGYTYWYGAYTSGSGLPTPAAGTPSSFSESPALIQGGIPPVTPLTIAELWFGSQPGFVNLQTEVNRRNFISDIGGARDLGVNGQDPTGVAPQVYLTQRGTMAATFALNNGRGGAFTVTGPILTDGVSDPPDSMSVVVTFTAPSTGQGVLGDYLTGNLYAFNPTTLLDNGVQRKWVRQWRAVGTGTIAAVSYKFLVVKMQTGINVPSGTTPRLMLRWSDDGGRSWSNERILYAGATGQTTQVIRFNRLGMTRRYAGSDRIFELSSSDPFMMTIQDAEVDAK